MSLLSSGSLYGILPRSAAYPRRPMRMRLVPAISEHVHVSAKTLQLADIGSQCTFCSGASEALLSSRWVACGRPWNLHRGSQPSSVRMTCTCVDRRKGEQQRRCPWKPNCRGTFPWPIWLSQIRASVLWKVWLMHHRIEFNRACTACSLVFSPLNYLLLIASAFISPPISELLDA